jgi:hypothetical protein
MRRDRPCARRFHAAQALPYGLVPRYLNWLRARAGPRAGGGRFFDRRREEVHPPAGDDRFPHSFYTQSETGPAQVGAACSTLALHRFRTVQFFLGRRTQEDASV